jgi:hypothetical protein
MLVGRAATPSAVIRREAMLNWIPIALGAASAFALSFLLHTVDVDRLEEKQAIALATQKTAMEKSCAEDKAITQGANDALQKNINIISSKLAASKRVHPANCLLAAPIKTDTSSGGGQHAGQNGISSDWLRDYAAECETYRQQRIVLEKFIDNTWERQ